MTMPQRITAAMMDASLLLESSRDNFPQRDHLKKVCIIFWALINISRLITEIIHHHLGEMVSSNLAAASEEEGLAVFQLWQLDRLRSDNLETCFSMWY